MIVDDFRELRFQTDPCSFHFRKVSNNILLFFADISNLTMLFLQPCIFNQKCQILRNIRPDQFSLRCQVHINESIHIKSFYTFQHEIHYHIVYLKYRYIRIFLDHLVYQVVFFLIVLVFIISIHFYIFIN